MNKKRCSKCHEIKIQTEYYKNKKNRDGLEYICKRCSKRRYYNSTKSKDGLYGRDKKIKEHWIYGKNDPTRNKKYIEDRAQLFSKHKNGWWWDMNKFSTTRYPSGKSKPIAARKRFHGEFVKEEE